MICLTTAPLSEKQAQMLVGLRQELLAGEPQNPYYRIFEGHICSVEALLHGGNIVYWGTSGQRIVNQCHLDPFSRMELRDYGRVIYGEDLRRLITRPSKRELHDAIRTHYHSIREHGSKTCQSLYSAGWILDIARCLYTLQTGKIIGKTQAGEWALENDCAGDANTMRRVLEIRREPLKYKSDSTTLLWLGALGSKVQEYANILEQQL